MNKHTPGPWYTRRTEGGYRRKPKQEVRRLLPNNRAGAIRNRLAVFDCGDSGEDLANATLAVAAPALLAMVELYASECTNCGGTGLVTKKTLPGGIEVDNDDQPCQDCIDIRGLIADATGAQRSVSNGD